MDLDHGRSLLIFFGNHEIWNSDLYQAINKGGDIIHQAMAMHVSMMQTILKFTLSAVLLLVIKCVWSSLSFKKTEEWPGLCPLPLNLQYGISK